jgi:hypothetical protein
VFRIIGVPELSLATFGLKAGCPRRSAGSKTAANGREGGRFSMEEMTELKWITIQSGQRAFPM